MAVDLAAIRKKVDELQNGRRNSNVQLWKPKEPGEYIVRGLPWPDKFTQPGQPFIERWFYYIGDSFGVPTLRQFNKPDPIAEFINELYKSGTPEDRLIAKKLRPKMQAYMPIVVKKGKDADPNKVIVWSFNKFLYQKMLNWFLDEEIGDYLDLEKGFDIKVTVTDSGKKFNGRTVLNSDVELARKQSPTSASSAETKKLLDAIPDIEGMFEMKTAEELENMMKKWLESGSSKSDPTTETDDRGGAPKTDALDDLVNDVKSADAAPAVTETKTEAKPEKSPKRKSKKDDDDSDEPSVKKQSLDDAFAELMADEE